METKYITCLFQGRMGNLMYEIACTLAAAWRSGATPVFPRKINDYYKDIPAFQNYISPLLEQFSQYDDRKIKFREYHEGADFKYKPIEILHNTKLVGYFTTSLYWDDYRENIIDIFSTHQPYVNDLANNIMRKYPGREFVSVHVRRTDYVTDYKWDLPLNYYEQAATHFEKPIYVIFSDDPEWCKQNLAFMQEKVFVSDKDYIELLLMGKFHAHIAANSTFSAMGIILGDKHKTKKVIAPKICDMKKHNGEFIKQEMQEKHWILI